ncbi:MarR family winged helix-turn-helix transcriptional regulator [Actinomyces graevenitzii]|nr:MarR family transcriptional regulator [Actinomyces graevenitzii]
MRALNMASSCAASAISGATGMGDDVAASASSSVAGGCGQGAAPKTAAAGAVVGCGQEATKAVSEPASGCGQEAAAAGCGQGDRHLLTESQMRAWRAFLGASTLVSARLNHELDEAAAISMYEYEILVRLFESEAGRVRMSQLADQVSYSRSRLTHTVGRLERAGYVLRSSCPNDRRGVYAHLTKAGYEFLAQTAPIHLDGVRRHLIDRFTPSELATLTELLEKITTDADLAH